jgi:signal transduction histidine kinase
MSRNGIWPNAKFNHDILTGKAEWSEEMYAILGIERSNAVPGHETLIQLIHPADRQKFTEQRAKEIAGQKTSVLEYRILCPDDSEKIVRRENAVVLDEQGRPVRRYGTLQDVTALRLAERRERELERQLLQSQKLEALGTLAGGIAHDLNNSLVPIMALSKLAARRLEPGNPIRDDLQTIYDASLRARDLVSRVLAFSRHETAEMCEFDLADVVAEALKFLDAVVPSTIRLETHLDSGPAIFANPTQIHQVVTNLVTNAVQAIGDGIGAISIQVRSVSGTAASPDVCLSVTDTGVGIDEAMQQRIFEPFFTTKPVGAGTGLGLSIVHGIVTSHGGRIDVSSALGKGTRFDVYFPTSAKEAISARTAA